MSKMISDDDDPDDDVDEEEVESGKWQKSLSQLDIGVW